MAIPEFVLSKLPTHIRGRNVELRANDPALWPLAKALTRRQRAVLGANISWIDFNKAFSTPEHYEEWLRTCAKLEQKTMQRWYWIVDPSVQRIAGLLIARVPENGNILVTGYEIFREYRRKGLASGANAALADLALKSGAIDYVCAETDPGNQPSAETLIKAGFREVAPGICTTRLASEGKIVRRFMKTNNARLRRWPLTFYMQPR